MLDYLIVPDIISSDIRVVLAGSHPLNFERPIIMRLFCLFLVQTVALFIISITNAAAQSCDPPPSGLVSWWAAEGNALDRIGTNNGTLVGNTTYGPGEVGEGFVFDGNGFGVQVSGATNLWLQNFTIETWIKRASTSVVTLDSAGNGTIFGYGPGAYYLGISGSAGTLFFSQDGNYNYVSGPAITDTNWHHVALTMTNGTVTFYLDGVASPPSSYNVTFTFTGGLPGIGFWREGGSGGFLGTIDEMSIYNRALASNEVAAIYLAGGAGKCFTPVAPIITTQPTNQTVFVGQPASFSVSASGTPTLSYQWRFNTTNIVGKTNASLLIANVQITNAGTYSVIVSNGVTSILSSNAVLTVNLPCDPPPSGLVSWWAAEGNAYDQESGNNGTLVGNTTYGPGEVGQGFVMDGNGSGVKVSGTTNLWLQNFTIETWIRRASTSVVTYDSGGNATIFGYGTGAYFLGISGSAGTLFFSQMGNYNYVSGPSITDTNWHHVAVTKVGSTVVFYLDGVAYATPAYSVTFTFAGGPPGIGYWAESGGDGFLGTIDEMSIYNRALASNEVAAIYVAGSAGKCFTPMPPSITSQPTNQTVFVGQPASFSVSASGTPPLSYQWRFNTTNIVNATNATLTLTNVQLTQAGNYSVLVTNIAGSTNSIAAALTINIPSCVAPPSGLVSWWAAEGNALDRIGTNNGTLVGNASYGVGEVGQAFVFDGNGSGVSVGNPPSLKLQVLTIEMWLKRGSSSVIGNGNGAVLFGYDTGGYLLWMDASGALHFNRNGEVYSTTGPTIADTNWHHVAMTFSGNTVDFYLDGNLADSVSHSVTFTFTTPAGIGCYADAKNQGFLGSLDEVSVYNRVLTSTEIQAIYIAGSEGKCVMPHAATATATLAGGFVVGANITGIGAGYTNTPLVHFIGGGGSGATATAVVSNGVVTAINMISAGSGYTNTPLVVIDPPFITNPVLGIAPASILTFSNLTIGAGYQLQQFQSWYWTNQPVSFTASNAAYVQAFSGAPSNGEYRLALAPVPAQAFATPQVVNGFVVGATITSGGSGYVTTPAVNITGVTGNNATAVAGIGGGAVTNITITNPGIGYTNNVTVQIDPPPAVALAPTISPGVGLNSSSLAPYVNYQVQFKSNLTGIWGNWSNGLFTPIATTNAQYIFITNGSGFFRLQYVP